MSKSSLSDSNWTQTSVASHAAFHPSLKSDVFGATDTQVLSVSQAAVMMEISEAKVRELIRQKVLCAKKDISGKNWLIERECAQAQA